MKLKLISVIFLFFLIQCTGTRPLTIGLKSQKLTPCPITPNCINSFSDPSDTIHYREPVKYTKPQNEAMMILKKRILDYPRTNIITENPDYIYAEFTSFLFRFVDDVEFYFDEKNKTLHFRSASRLGSGDLGVNRKRVDALLLDLDI